MAKVTTSGTPDAERAEAFRALLAEAKLSQMGAARALRVAPRTVRSWALGERPWLYAVELALRYLAKHPREGWKKHNDGGLPAGEK